MHWVAVSLTAMDGGGGSCAVEGGGGCGPLSRDISAPEKLFVKNS